MAREIYRYLHGAEDIYDFGEPMPEDRQGWGSTHPVFEQTIKSERPSLVIEVGTWKGGSALHIAERMQAAGIDGEIVCIDTFLGSPEHWLVPKFKERLMLKHGRAGLYMQFLSNVVHAGLQHTITPFAASSDVAAEVLRQRKIQADLIYIDGAHDYRAVRADLRAYWPLLRPGGTMIGDDFTTHWHGVVRAVSEFADRHDLKLNDMGGKWLLRKPQAE
jgi:predicted O-methyltransferase YrrM